VSGKYINKFLARKLNSFGLIEAVIASTVMALILIGAAVLSSSTLRSSIVEENYHEAEHIADALLEKVKSAKDSGLVVFVKNQNEDLESSELLSADCFDTSKRDGTNCKTAAGRYKDALPYYDSPTMEEDANGYILVKNNAKIPFNSSNFPAGFFRWKVTVTRPEFCQGIGPALSPTPISGWKCRRVQVEVKWDQPSGEKSYLIRQYFTDWSR